MIQKVEYYREQSALSMQTILPLRAIIHVP